MSDPVVRLNAALEARYTIERELGEGGMATVYLTDDINTACPDSGQSRWHDAQTRADEDDP